mgnify:CR=1 FL=1
MVDLPFSLLFVSSNSQSSIVTEFLPSITIPSEALEINLAFFTVISAVEYIVGDPCPVVVYVPLSTVTVPPLYQF